MLTYNTQLRPLILPEYGRNIQEMVDYCVTIPDFEERTACAYAIVAAMSALFPDEGFDGENRRNFWDHLNIMSDFQLDIDWPVEVVQQSELATKPEKVPYQNNFIHYRHYGKNLERLIDRAASMEEGEERDALVLLLANHMKKAMLAVNIDGVDDDKIFKDLAELSHGRILVDPDKTHLHEFKTAPVSSGKKKKKK